MGKWIKSWNVPSSMGSSYYVVSIDRDGNYGCSCPVWKFRREECKHIKQVKGGEYSGHPETTKFRLDNKVSTFAYVHVRMYTLTNMFLSDYNSYKGGLL